MFRDRLDAGRRLAERLEPMRGRDAVVLGLPRGGVPVARVVADALYVPLDVIVVRKLGAPGNPELALGAVGEGQTMAINPDVLWRSGATPDQLEEIVRRERAEVASRLRRFRGRRAGVPLTGRVAIVVDDGIATGATARAACEVARAQGAARVVLATPVVTRDTVRALREVADEVVAVAVPHDLFAISGWYEDFAQVDDDDVSALLRTGARPA